MKLTVVYVAIIAMLVYFVVFGHNGLLKYAELVKLETQYQEQLRIMDAEIVRLKRELELLKTDKNYLDYVIRRDLGLQKADEDQYIIMDNAAVQGQ